MRSRRLLVALMLPLALGMGGAALAALPGAGLPHRYIPGGRDGKVVEVVRPADGQVWAAWAYWTGSEYDIAVSSLEENGLWSEPTFLGAGDGLNQVQPSLAADAAGNLYLAHATGGRGRVYVWVLSVGSSRWAGPTPVTGDAERGSHPALAVAGNSLVVAFRSRDGVTIRLLPLVEPDASTHGTQDGPDGFPLPGADGSTGKGVIPPPSTGGGGDR